MGYRGLYSTQCLYISPIRPVWPYPESFVPGMSPFSTAQASQTSTDMHQIISQCEIFITKSIPLLHSTWKYRSSIGWFRITKQILCFPGEGTQKWTWMGRNVSAESCGYDLVSVLPFTVCQLRKTHCNFWFHLMRFSSK